MVSISSIIEFFTWSFYRNLFHRLPGSFHIKYFIFIMLSTLFLRGSMFYFYHFPEFFNTFTVKACATDFVNTFPDELSILWNSKRQELNFFANDIQFRPEQKQEITLPKCVQDFTKISTGFLFKSTLAQQFLSVIVNPVVLLSSDVQESPTIKVAKEFFGIATNTDRNPKSTFMNISPSKSRVFDTIPVTYLINIFVRMNCRQENEISSISKGNGLCILDKSVLKKNLMLYSQLREQNNSRKIKDLALYNCFIMFMLTFSLFLEMADVIALSLLIQYLLSRNLTTRMFWLSAEEETALNEISGSQNKVFYLCVHCTSICLVNGALFLSPYADMFGFIPIFQIFYALFIVRFFALKRSNASVVTTISFDENLELSSWLKLYSFQSQIVMISKTLSLSPNERVKKLADVVNGYAINLQEHFLHVWSSQNVNSTGPGYCFALCNETGCFILVTWYESPISESGINVITKYPGKVFISDKVMPIGDFLLSREELKLMKSEIKTLESLLRNIEESTR